MSKNRIWYTVLLTACMVLFWWIENYYVPTERTSSTKENTDLPFEEVLLPESTTGEVVVHNHYMLSYSEAHEQAEWVAYTLERSHLTYDDRKRPYFIEDPRVRSRSADWRNYRGSGYDRGHLCPAGDRRFSKEAYDETFFTSNISPQRNDFNGGIWNRLEQQVRQWCKQKGTLHIITGGVLSGRMDEIGEEDVDVPRSFYKIVAHKKGSTYQIAAFLLPHKESKLPLSHFLVTVDSLETLTGIDFFNTLGTQEEHLEKKIEKGSWSF